MMKENLIKIDERSFIDNWELPALTDYNTGESLTYGDFARNIARLHLLFKNCGVNPGDRIALIGKNIPTALSEIVSVRLEETDGETNVSIWEKNNTI